MLHIRLLSSVFFFFFNDTATTEIYTLSLHDALPISTRGQGSTWAVGDTPDPGAGGDRKSTRLNSSHPSISYAVFCLKKKKHNKNKILPEIRRTTSDGRSHQDSKT